MEATTFVDKPLIQGPCPAVNLEPGVGGYTREGNTPLARPTLNLGLNIELLADLSFIALSALILECCWAQRVAQKLAVAIRNFIAKSYG